MSKIKVTFRQKQIILMLIENGNVPKTIKDISIELNVRFSNYCERTSFY